MHRRDSQLIASPTDLSRFVESRFAVWAERFDLDRPGELARDPQTEIGELLKREGREHERRLLQQMRDDGRHVVTIASDDERFEKTQAAIEGRAEIIHQAALRAPGFEGYADFLVRDDDGGYTALEAKVSRQVRVSALVQLACYGWMLEQSGCAAEELALALPEQTHRFRHDAVRHYFRELREQFTDFLEQFDPEHPPRPEAGAKHAPWQTLAEQRWRAGDSIALVAGIREREALALERDGLTSIDELVRWETSETPPLSPLTMERLQSQAKLQQQYQEDAPLPALWLERNSNRSPLPPANENDRYFDLTGYPVGDSPLEFLWSLDGAERWQQWAHDGDQEIEALRALLQQLTQWREAAPQAHLYHFGPRPLRALQRIALTHAVGERELDDLLEHGVFVDLSAALRERVRLGVPDYALETLDQRLLGHPPRDEEPIVTYDRWRLSDDAALLESLAEQSAARQQTLRQLAVWLRENGPAEPAAAALTPPASSRAKVDDIEARLDERASESGHAALLRQLLRFHQREEKPGWWRFFDQRTMSDEQRFEDFDCLAGLQLVRRARDARNDRTFRYDYDPKQQTRIDVGTRCYINGDLELAADVTAIAVDHGAVRIEFPYRSWQQMQRQPPKKMTLIPRDLFPNDKLTGSLLRLTRRYLDGGRIPAAIDDLLSRQPPRLQGRRRGAVLEENLEQTVARLDSSCLLVQGPPGTGKTTAAAKAILRCLAEGQRVAVMSNSHHAIGNLLAKCVALGPDDLRPLKVGGSPDDPLYKIAPSIRSARPDAVAGLLQHHPLVGGTAWLFCRDALTDRFDLLFVDEAGQVPLANLVAAAPAARNLVLLGDPLQLPQPTQGAHPGASGQSALGYALDGAAIVPSTQGLFLDRTYRLHPDLCRPISEAFYENRLTAAAGNERRRLLDGEPEAGIAFIPVEHRDRTQRCPEEAERIAALVDELCTRRWSDGEQERPLSPQEILVVAPYNLQVRELKRRLPESVRVGTVDKFQGQEAPVVILSLTSSDAQRSPRGVEFLLDPNRLNVALSRAQSLAFVVGHPEMVDTRCSSWEQLRRINLFFRFARRRSAD